MNTITRKTFNINESKNPNNLKSTKTQKSVKKLLTLNQLIKNNKQNSQSNARKPKDQTADLTILNQLLKPTI